MRAAARIALAVGVALIGLVGCSRPSAWEQEDAAEAAKAFLAAVELRDLATVWEFLAPSDQAALELQAQRFRELGGEGREAWEFLSPGHVASSPREWASVRVDEDASSESHAVVLIELHDERVITLEMDRDDGRWTIDLPGL